MCSGHETGSLRRVVLFRRGIVGAQVIVIEGVLHRAPANSDPERIVRRRPEGVPSSEIVPMMSFGACFFKLSVIRDTIAT